MNTPKSSGDRSALDRAPETVEATEAERVVARYGRRDAHRRGLLYDPLLPSVYMARQERERALIRWINSCGISPVDKKIVIEIGCGAGSNLLTLMQLGFSPQNLTANELLPERASEARLRLPACIPILQGDASECDLPNASFDVVVQSTVFSSLLDDGFQRKVASRMWDLARPGGGILWYDFVYNNPRNPDVRGVPPGRIRELFPQAEITAWRVTLAPPISRRVTGLSPTLYSLINILPFMRTHLLCWIRKSPNE